MSKNYTLTGIGSNVEVGKDGPRIKDNSGVVEIKDNTDSALAVIRGADAIGSTDLVTKSQLDAIDTSIKYVTVDFAYDSSSPLNIGSALPANATVLRSRVKVDTTFDGTTPTLAIGISGSTTDIMSTTDNNLQTATLYVKNNWVEYVSSSQLIATITVSGASQGAGSILVEFIS